MTTTMKALIWAAIIIATAAYSKATGLSDAASFAMTMGLSGAALASLNLGRNRCGARKSS